MIIRTLRPCEVAGRTVASGLMLELLESEADALIDAGAAEPIDPAPAGPMPQPAPSAPEEE